MKRTLTGFLAASVVIGTAIPTVLATTSMNQWFKMTIQVNGTILSTPFGVAENDGSTTTTYIPMYYVNQALTKVGYQVAWNGITQTWDLTASQKGLGFSSSDVGSGNIGITVNGQLMRKINAIVQRDPEGGVDTTYIPIYYVTPLFQAFGISNVWNGITHQWSITGQSGGSSSSSTNNNLPGSGATNINPPSIALNQSNASANITVSNASSGAMLILYNTNGSEILSTSATTDGTATFYNVGTGSYYVVENLNGSKSGQSNVVTVTANTSTSTPSIFSGQSNGAWYIGVNNAASGAVLTLYSTNGNKIASINANQSGNATFNNVMGGTYYVVETLNDLGYQSNAISINTTTGAVLSIPIMSVNSNNGIGSITVSNVVANATVFLYTLSGAVYSTATANSSGYATFNNVGSGTYYAVQAWNGTQSAASNDVSVNTTTGGTLSVPSTAVNTNNGIGSITVSNVVAGATVFLYTSAGAVYSTATAISPGYATFNNVGSGTYYVVQAWNGAQSAASNNVSVNTTTGGTLSVPSTAVNTNNGIGTITVSNVVAGATVFLYTSTGAVYSTATANSSGYATFNNVGSGTYYVVQAWNGAQSAASNNVIVNTTTNNNLSTPNATINTTNGVETITISNVVAGAVVYLYTSNGAVYSTVIANSSGYATFSGMGSGIYFAVQAWNGVRSTASNDVVA